MHEFVSMFGCLIRIHMATLNMLFRERDLALKQQQSTRTGQLSGLFSLS